jgi:DNA topoisomerase-1
MRLLVVESPAKARKIEGFLRGQGGEPTRVVATLGHLRRLTPDLDALGAERGWTPTYEVVKGRGAALARLRALAAEASVVLLGADDDREGEAIAAAVAALLRLPAATTPRVVFHEVTPAAVAAALAAPRRVDESLVLAQQARAMLDMLVGFSVSRHLAARLRGVGSAAAPLSAGRCQTPALTLLVEREAAVAAFAAAAAESEWRLSAAGAGVPRQHALRFCRQGAVRTKADAVAVMRGLLDGAHAHLAATGDGASGAVTHVAATATTTTAAPPPLTTAALYGAAAPGLTAPQAMAAAQRLYEAGRITYHRTDSATIGAGAAAALRAVVAARFGDALLGAPGAHVAAGGGGAHEAIRPTDAALAELPDGSAAEKAVYALVWRAAVASQMAPHVAESRGVTVEWRGDAAPWTATPRRVTQLGWRRLAAADADADGDDASEARWAAWLPVAAGQRVEWAELHGDESRPAGPQRYTDAALIRELERRGIGRPSTFASIVETLHARLYAERLPAAAASPRAHVASLRLPCAQAWPPKEAARAVPPQPTRGRLKATARGVAVAAALRADFGDVLGCEFTAALEARLDAVAAGAEEWRRVLTDTWAALKPRLAVAVAAAAPPPRATKAAAATALGDLDGSPVLLHAGRYGPYVTWRDTRASLGRSAKAPTLEQAAAAIRAADATLRQAGGFTVKRGADGSSYVFKPSKGGAKPAFVPWPAHLDAATVAVETIAAVHAGGAAVGAAAAKKPRRGKAKD